MKSSIEGDHRIFGSRFVDELKEVGQRLKRKSLLEAQTYAEEGTITKDTKEPTVQRYYERLALSIEASMKTRKTYTRDITRAYIQSHTNLERDVYITAPRN